MKLGIISDIHANEPALQAVLADMPEVDSIICAGDIVGYNPWPETTVETIRNLAETTVLGNHDRLVESPQAYRHNVMAEAGLRYAKAHLEDNQLSWLSSRPRRATIAEDYLLVHSHPNPDRQDEYVYPEEFASLQSYLDNFQGIILGHTHIQHLERFDDGFVLNPGSVGQPRDGKKTAAYAILETKTNEIELKRTHYDIDRVYHEVVVNDLPVETGERLFDGR